MADLSYAGILWLSLSALAALGASSGFFLPYWLRGTYPPPPPPSSPAPSQPQPHSPTPTLTYPTPVFLNSWRRCNYPRLVTSFDPQDNDDDEGRRENVRRGSDAGDEGGKGVGGGVGDVGVVHARRGGGLVAGGGAGGGAPPPRPPLRPRVEVVAECGRYTRFTDIPSVWWQIGTVIAGTGSALALLVAMAGAWALCVRYVLTKGTAKLAAGLQLVAGLLIGGGVALYPLGWGSQEVQQVCGPSASVFRLGHCELYWAFYLTASAAGLTLLCSMLAICAPSSKAQYS